MSKVYHIRISDELERRLVAVAPKSLPRTTAIRLLLERQVEFEERRTAGRYSAPPAPGNRPAGRSGAEQGEDYVIVYD